MIAVLRVVTAVLFAVLWALVVRSDMTHQKVRHGHLFYGLLGAALAYGALLLQTVAGIKGWVHVFYSWGFYKAVLLHVTISGAVAMALWQLRMWPAGDAKLFTLLAAFYPILQGSFAAERLFLSFLINTFIPAAAFLFATAVWYMINTRLLANRAFFAELGWRRALDAFFSAARATLSSWKARLLSATGSVDRLGWGGLFSGAKKGAALLLPKIFQWISGLVFMSVIAYYLKGATSSPLMLVLLCMALLTLWNQVSRLLGLRASRVLLAVGAAGLLVWKPLHWDVLFLILGNLSVFSFCMFVGMNAATSMLAGGWSAAASLVTPFLFMGFSLAVAFLGRLLSSALSAAVSWTHDAAAAAHGQAAPMAQAAGSALKPLEQARGLTALLNPLLQWRGFGPLAPYAGTMLELAGLGVFFGLSLVLVRIWDDEVRPTHRAEALAANLLLAPSFVDRVAAEDEEFFETHMSSLYADGLTREQAEVLRAWCAEHGVADVPLAPTVSFAAWIFVGVFLSLVMRGRHVLEVIL